jgi:hypothetical protein
MNALKCPKASSTQQEYALRGLLGRSPARSGTRSGAPSAFRLTPSIADGPRTLRQAIENARCIATRECDHEPLEHGSRLAGQSGDRHAPIAIVGLHGTASAMQSRLDVAFGDCERIGSLACRVVEYVAQNEHRALWASGLRAGRAHARRPTAVAQGPSPRAFSTTSRTASSPPSMRDRSGAHDSACRRRPTPPGQGRSPSSGHQPAPTHAQPLLDGKARALPC